jgi:hypothetical protein
MSNMFDHNWYNSLLTIKEADEAFTNRDQLFERIVPLLARSEFREKYNLSLVHRHVVLEAGERMVATGLITQPEKVSEPTPSDIIPSSWTATGIPFEWTRVKASEEVIQPPPAELIKELSEIVGEGSVLGLTLAQELVPDGQIWCERTDSKTRQHILEMQPVDEPSGDNTQGAKRPSKHFTSWMITTLSGKPTICKGCSCRTHA